jgi:hypothetical protein
MTDETIPTLNPNTPIPSDNVLELTNNENLIKMINTQGLALQADRASNIESLKVARDTVSPPNPIPSEDTIPLPPDDGTPPVVVTEKPIEQPATPSTNRTQQEIEHSKNNAVPILSKTQQEIAAGRAKVQEHEGRAAMMAGKEKATTSEGQRVAAARTENEDL